MIYQPQNKSIENYGNKKLEIVDVVDGQQRLTTCTLYLSIIINELIKNGKEQFKDEISLYLYSGNQSKLILNNDTADIFFNLMSKGITHNKPNSIHQKRILNAYKYLKNHIDQQFKNRTKQEYLENLFDAIIRKLNFSFYPIESESEIGMTFELMNSRGKDLSPMELLKNYLMYWIYRNIENVEKKDFTYLINKTWKEVYINIAKCTGNEIQCLRIVWILYVNHTPKNWDGYNGFKADNVIPLRDFAIKSKPDTKDFIQQFANGLALISKHYSEIINPNKTSNEKEFELISKIKNAGNLASYLPLMVAVRISRENNQVNTQDYFNFLKSLEKFSYRVFLWSGKRSNTGLSSFYYWANSIFSKKHSLTYIINQIYGLLNLYSREHNFRKALKEEFFDWYNYKRLLKYTLFEYELFLLQGKNKPKLSWEDLSDSTIEHILPQNPKRHSHWLEKWQKKDIDEFLHDISNLVLTKDNSRYLNFEFKQKKGFPGVGFSYSNSDIKQERKIAEYNDWTPLNCKKRRKDLIEWIIQTWGIENPVNDIVYNIDDDDDDVVVI